jgi:hypothetical protein
MVNVVQWAVVLALCQLGPWLGSPDQTGSTRHTAPHHISTGPADLGGCEISHASLSTA